MTLSETEKKRLLEQEQVNLPALLELYFNVNVLFCVADSSGYFTLLNPYWTKVLGWSLEELKSKPFIEFVHPDDRISTDTQADKQFIDNQSVASFVNRYQTKDGQFRWLEWTAKSPNGGAIYAVAHDITVEKENEQALKQVQDRLQELVQNVPGAFFQYIIETDGTHSVQYMSPGCVDIWGLTVEEIGHDPSDLWAMILPEDIEQMQESIEYSVTHLTRWEQEYRIKLPSGDIRWLRGIGNPRRLESGGTFWNSLVMDLTQLREQQDTISRMQRMEMIGHLASGVSHDFNNILAIIDGHRQLINMKAQEPDIVEHTEVMGAAIKRAKQLTKRLLMSSKKKIVPTGQRVPVSVSVAELRSLLDQVTPANIKVNWDIDTDARAMVESSEFDDVVTNLFINARNALDQKGNITVRLSSYKSFHQEPHTYVHLKPEKADSYSVISVIDNGTGIPRENFEKIFIPFISSSKSGTGLGLAMAVGFASRNNCGITLSSEEGRGTNISLWLPEFETQNVDNCATTTAPKYQGNYRIVVIDDEPEVQGVVSAMLEIKGHSVTSFTDSQEAIDWLSSNEHAVDLILADEVMPGDVQGHDIYNAFNKRIPVLIMSGYLDVKNYDLGKVEALQKPLSIEMLQQSIQKVINRRT